MTYTLNPNGGVIRDSDGAFIPADPLNTDYAAYLAWVATGNIADPVPSPPAPTQDQLIKQLTVAVQAIMDTKAQAYNYDDLTTVVTYADEPVVPKFQEEGQAFREWRSLVWDACYAYLAEVEAGTKPFPTVDELPSLLPAFSLDTSSNNGG